VKCEVEMRSKSLDLEDMWQEISILLTRKSRKSKAELQELAKSEFVKK